MLLFSGTREWVCSQAEGDVLEIAAGTARNLAHYPEGVRVTGVELSPEMAELGRKRAEELGREIDLRVGDAEALDFPDESFDTVVCTYGLCTIPTTARRSAKRSGCFGPAAGCFSPSTSAAPTRSSGRSSGCIEPLAHRFGGDHLLREPLDHLTGEGFEVERSRDGRRPASWNWSLARKPA